MIVVLTFLRMVPGRSWAIVGALAGVLILVTYCSHQAVVRERDRAEAANQAAARAAEGRRNAAAERSADERLADTLSTQAREKELADAVAPLPDATPSDRRIALACARMRADGLDTSDVPACRRFER
jgi:Tfp pilus assembly protein PilE